MEQIRSYLREAAEVLEEFSSNDMNLKAIEKAGSLMTEALLKGGKLISCGNGGSMSDAMHFAEELTGRFRADRRSLPALAISDPAYLSCVTNDYGYSQVFSRFIEGFGKQEDVLLAISTSGNSENVLEAARAARQKGMKVVALTGKDGGRLASECDIEIRAPKTRYADHVQEIHIKVIHILIDFIERTIE